MPVTFTNLSITQYTAPPSEFFEVSKTSTTANTITVPSSAQVNDFALIVCFGSNPAANDTTPSGWTKIQTILDTTGVGHRISSFGKIIASGDISSSVSVLGSLGSTGSVMFVFRNLGWFVGPNFTAGNLQSASTTGNPNPITITPIASRNMSVGIKYTYGGTSAFSTNPFDGTHIVDTGSTGSLIVGYKYQKSTTSTVTFDSNDNGNAQTQAGYYISFNDAV